MRALSLSGMEMGSLTDPTNDHGAAPIRTDRRAHASALAELASTALREGRFHEAFRLSDRLCRLTPDGEVRFLLLRSRALRGLGKVEDANADLERAYERDPTDHLIVADVLEFGSGIKRTAAARALIGSPYVVVPPNAAIAALLATGIRAVGNLRLQDNVLEGWIACPDRDNVEIGIRTDAGVIERLVVSDAAEHAAGDQTFFLSEIKRTISKEATGADLYAGRLPLTPSFLVFRRLPDVRRSVRVSAPAARPEPRDLTVVLPVYGDPTATAICLRSLERQKIEGSVLKAIIINDNPGDAEIARVCAEAGAVENFHLVENRRNLGFVESVNRAFAMCEGDDVLLLNADVVLPPGAIQRLRACAYSANDIGTVVPFSNNAELTSFPRMLHAAPLPSLIEIEYLDRVASRVNKDRCETILHGTGFCLYIRAACLDRVGSLHGGYLRGYYEDVELSLRARAAGFRNVCATNVYVGHAGTRSFGDEKTALVRRNLKVVSARFPDFMQETAAFLEADPLRRARARIEAEVLRAGGEVRLILANDRRDISLAIRLEQLREAGIQAFVLTPLSRLEAHRHILWREGNDFPQSLQFTLDKLGDRRRLLTILKRIAVKEIEIFDDFSTPALAEAVLRGVEGRAILISDRSPIESSRPRKAAVCPDPSDDQPCVDCASRVAPDKGRAGFAAGALTTGASQRISFHRMAKALLDYVGVSSEPVDPVAKSASKRNRGPGRGPLGILSPTADPETERLIGLLAARVPDRGVVILGQTLRDAALLSHQRVSVTGPIGRTDYLEAIQRYEISGIFGPDRAGGFRLLDDLGDQTKLPIAYFDWSYGVMPTRPGDLALDPRLCDTKAVRRLLSWLDRGRAARGDAIA